MPIRGAAMPSYYTTAPAVGTALDRWIGDSEAKLAVSNGCLYQSRLEMDNSTPAINEEEVQAEPGYVGRRQLSNHSFLPREREGKPILSPIWSRKTRVELSHSTENGFHLRISRLTVPLTFGLDNEVVPVASSMLDLEIGSLATSWSKRKSRVVIVMSKVPESP